MSEAKTPEQKLSNLAQALWRDAEEEAKGLRSLLLEAYPIVCSFQCSVGKPGRFQDVGHVAHSKLCCAISEALSEPTAL